MVFGVFLAVIGAGLLHLHQRLAEGPIEVGALVAPLQDAINRDLSGLRVVVGSAVLQRPESGVGLQVRLRDVLVRDDVGGLVARAPLAAVDLSMAGLMTGRIAAERIDFIRPRLLLFYRRATGLAVGFAPQQIPVTDDIVGPDGSTASSDGRRDSQATPDGEGGSPSDLLSPENAIPAVSLVRALSDGLQRARRGEHAGGYLTRFGVRDAVVLADIEGTQTFLNVPEFALELTHRKKRSKISGNGSVLSSDGPWKLAFQIDESEKQKRLRVATWVSGLVPRAFADLLPDVRALRAFAVPTNIQSIVELSHQGDMREATMSVQLGRGQILVGDIHDEDVIVSGGRAEIAYDAQVDHWTIRNGWLRTEASELKLAGIVRSLEQPGSVASSQPRRWRFDLQGRDAVLVGGGDLGSERAEDVKLSGVLTPATGALEIDAFRVAFQQGAFAARGRVQPDGSAVFAGQVRGVGVETVKRFWPRALAPASREWVRDAIQAGTIDTGTVSLARTPKGGLTSRVELDAVGVEIIAEPGFPVLSVPRLALVIGDTDLRATAATASVAVPRSAPLNLRNAKFVIPDLNGVQSSLETQVTGEAPALARFLAEPVIDVDREMVRFADRMTGRVSADLAVSIPLEKTAGDVVVLGSGRIQNLDIQNVTGSLDLKGGVIEVELSEATVESKGTVLLNGVAVDVSWLRLRNRAQGAPAEPVRLTATLDEADRTQLGLPINDMVRGPIDVSLSLSAASDDAGFAAESSYVSDANADNLTSAGFSGDGRDAISRTPAGPVNLQVDLARATISVAPLSWTKPAGQAAVLQANLRETDAGLRIDNVRIRGADNVAIDGWAQLDAENQLSAFALPTFSVDVITQLSLEGSVAADDVWKLRVRGRSFDGRKLFQSLFSIEDLAPNSADEKAMGGLDLDVDVQSVLGFYDTTVQDLVIRAQRRAGRLSAFEAFGSLTSDRDLGVRLVTEEDGHRYMIATTQDAGAAFRLVGFYRNVRGGDAALRVRLDDRRRSMEKIGILWAQNFILSDDEVVERVLTRSQDSFTRDSGSRTRTSGGGIQMRFNQLYAPFAVGGGQFRLLDAFINGPALGATLRGTVDMKRKLLRLDGTYVPLYGLNAAIGTFPIFGDLLIGRRGEGIFGITFQIVGPLNNPETLVNPMSLVAPGIFRQIFEFPTPPSGANLPGVPGIDPVRPSATIPESTYEAGRRSRPTVGGDASASQVFTEQNVGTSASGRVREDGVTDWITQTQR